MSAYDIRPAVGEQVRSLGATFVQAQVLVAEAEQAGGYAKELSTQAQGSEQDLVHQTLKGMDFVISTAAVPGKKAPILITGDMVRDMQPGSVIVDIAAETGGNCELTKPGEQVVERGVVIHGPLGLPNSLPVHASQMYSRNISSFLLHLLRDGEVHLDLDDEIIFGCCVTHERRILHAPDPARPDVMPAVARGQDTGRSS
jgi:NAD(P) transhydrogenase subunit alpha